MPVSRVRLWMLIGVSLCAFLFLVAAPQAMHAQGKTVIVFAPHPDDEALCCSGIIYANKQAGNTVKVVVMTNGDFQSSVSFGEKREGETVAAMSILGLSEQDIIFLGYGDQTLQALYQSSSPTTVVTSSIGQTHTYGNRGLGVVDYHTFLNGSAGSYNRQTILSDVEAVLQNFKPDEIYTTGLWDSHIDHRGTFNFVVEALLALRKSGVALSTRVHEMIIHEPCANCSPTGYRWPNPPFTPAQPFFAPPFLVSNTSYQWNQIETIPSPAPVLDPNFNTNLKALAIQQYPSQGGNNGSSDWLFSFVKEDEFFWDRDFRTNLAGLATVTVSSQDPVSLGTGAVDGFIDGATDYNPWEWNSNGTLNGSWIQLNWASPVTISQIALYGRPSGSDSVVSGTLLFSDSTAVPVGALPGSSYGLLVSFAPKTVTSVRFTIDNATGITTGLAEIETYGKLASDSTNHAPQIWQGPTATSTTITDAQTTNLNVNAFDVDADTLSYSWTSNMGTVAGSGATAVFTPPVVAVQTYAAITVTITDGKGGSIQNTTYVTVTPSNTSGMTVSSLVLNPTSVASGGSSTGTVTLNSVAPHGAVVSVSSSNTGIATTPATAIVLAGSNSTNFTVNTTFVASTTSMTISASLGSSTRNASLTVLQPPVILSSITVNPATLGGGGPAGTGTVTLNGPALGGGALITLTSSLPSVVTLPANVTVPAGLTSATFPITTSAVTSAVQVTISGSFVGQTLTTSQRVSPFVAPNLATIATVTVSSESTSTGQLGIKAIDEIVDGAPGDFTKEWATNGQLAGAWIRLTWTSPVAPSQVVLYDRPNLTDNITSGTLSFSDSSSVPVGALPNDGSPLTVSFTSRAVTWMQFTVNTAVGQNIGLAEISVTGSAAPVTITSVTLNPPVVTGGAAVLGTVTLSAPAPGGGATVVLSGNNNTVALVDPSVTVPAGQTTANFNVLTNTVTSISGVTVSGVYNGTKSTNLAVNPAGVTPISVWTPDVTPTTADNGPGSPIEVGVRFFSDSDGYALGVRFYKGPANTGIHVGNLWNSSGQLLATATFTGETASGWQQVIFSSPVHITANTNYIVSYHSSTGDYSVDPFWFEAGTPTDSAPLHLPGDQPGAPNGVFANGATSTFPNTSNNASNYWVDVLFDVTPTTLAFSTQLLPDGYQGGFYFQTLGATGGTQPYTYSLVSGALPPGTTLASNGIIDGTPAASGTFNFTLRVTDSGTVQQTLTQPFGLTVAPAGGCPCTLWPAGTVPGTLDNGATTPIELGMRFEADSDGFITAIQFYKGASNSGPHTVNLWTSGGQLLSTATSSAETGSGWQLVSLPSAVHITANTPYIASYHSNSGDYSVDTDWFAFGTPSDNAPLHAPGDVLGAPNGVFSTSGTPNWFPSASSQASNYWVDITYSPVPGPNLTSLSISPTSGKGSATGTVTLSAVAPPGGEVVNLTSSYSPLVTVPATVTVSAGSTSTNFPITMVPVPSTVVATITATGNGVQTATLTVLPPSLTAVSVNPTSVIGGAPSTGTVTLDSPASVLGVTVTLSSGNTAVATVPASVNVGSGATTASFTVTTLGVASSTPVIITATADVQQTTTLTVTPATLLSLTLNPTSVVGGTINSTGTVTLTGRAPTGGALVSLSSDNAAATVPANVTVLAGTTSATFTVSTTSVVSSVTANITTSYMAAQLHAALLVTPPGGGGNQQLASDSFNRPDGTLGPNWTTTQDADSAPAIAGQLVRTTFGRAKALYYGGINWPADQYAQAQVVASLGNGSTGPTVRMTSNGNFYAGTVGSFGTGNANVFILLDNNGSTSVIASSSTATVLANDFIQLSVQGTSLILADVTRSTTLLTVTDSTISVGYPGVYVSDGPAATLANWSAGSGTTPLVLTTFASDNFNRANSPNLGPNWTVGPGYFSIQIINNQIESDGQGQPPGAGHGKEYYTATTFPSDQWSQAQVISSNNDVNGAIVRYQGSVDTHYVGFVSMLGAPGTCVVTMDRDIAGAPVVLANDNRYCSVSSGDVLRLQVQGSLLSYIDVTTGSLLLTTTDTVITGGSPGWSLNPVGGTPTAAGWSGGQVGGTGSI